MSSNTIASYWSLLKSQDYSFVSDELSALGGLLLVGFLILTPLIYFYKFTGAAVGASILSFACSLAFLYFAAMGSAWSTASPAKQPPFWIDFLPLFLLCLLFFAFLSFGIYMLCQVYKGEPFNKGGLILWTVIIVAAPLAMYAKEFISQSRELFNYISVDVILNHDIYYPVVIDRLEFIDSSSGESRAYRIRRKYDYTLPDLKKLEALDLKSRYNLNKEENRKEYLNQKIPVGTDKFLLAWYAPLEDKYYSDEFPFPKEKMGIVEDSYNNLGKFIRRLHIHIFPGANAVLYNHKKFNLQNYHSVVDIDITDSQRQQFKKTFYEFYKHDGSPDELEDRLALLISRQEADQIAEQIKFYNWQLVINASEVESVVSFFDLKRNSSRVGLGKEARGALPEVIKFQIANQKYEMYFDKKQLAKLMKSFGEVEKGTLVNIVMDVESEDLQKTSVEISTDQRKEAFSDFELLKM